MLYLILLNIVSPLLRYFAEEFAFALFASSCYPPTYLGIGYLPGGSRRT